MKSHRQLLPNLLTGWSLNKCMGLYVLLSFKRMNCSNKVLFAFQSLLQF